MINNASLKILNILFVILVLYTFLYGIGNYGLLDKDEPRYCGTALEMIERGDWIVPRFNFENRFDKPVLFYWLIALTYKFFGVSDFTSRLPSAICATLCVLFTWYVTRKVFGDIVGFIAALILASSVEFVLLGRRSATDMALCFFFSASLYSIFLSYFLKDIKMKIAWLILSGIFSGLSVLTKGPIGIILPLIILSVFSVFRRQFNLKHLKIYFIFCLFSALVSLPWYIFVHQKTNGLFTNEFFFKHNFERFTSVVGEHPGPFWFYIPVILGGFMPWTLFFLPATFCLIKRIKNKGFNKFILFNLIWAITVFLFFSFCKSKLPTYILLLFPPIAIITGYWICILGRKKFSIFKLIIGLVALTITCAAIVAIILINKSHLETIDKSILYGKLFVSYVTVIIGLALSSFVAKKYYTLIPSFVFSILIPLIFLLNSYLVIYYKYHFDELRDFAKLARQLGAKEIISFGGYKPVLSYYGRVPIDFSDSKLGQIKKIRSSLSNNKTVFIIGYLSDVRKNSQIVVNNKEFFERLEVVKAGKRYFVGKFS